MVTRIITCYHCESENIVKNGKAPNGKQKYLCRDCARQSREDPGSNAYAELNGVKNLYSLPFREG
jgi:transposase-like protein